MTELENNDIKNADFPQQELEKRIFHLKTLYDVSQEISFLRDPQEIMQNLLLMTMGNFGTFKGFIILFDRREKAIENKVMRGFDQDISLLFSQQPELDFFLNLKKTLQLTADDKKTNSGDHKALLKALSSIVHILIPFFIDNKYLGCVGLGEKLSEQGYSVDDAELLETIAGQGAVAIKNAMLVEQMKKEENVRTNLARYLSPQVVEKIISQDVEVNLGGERKEVTVLFSDIRSFTSITETMPPGKLILILNEYFTEMVRVIFKHKGSVDKFVGDAVIAVFGSLLQTDLHAEQAVCAASEMMDAMTALNQKWLSTYDGFSMEMGIGINTGKAFIGNIGSPERMEFTVIGDIVNVAARMSDAAKPGQILISGSTRRPIQGNCLQYKELPPMQLKGKSQPLNVYHCYHRREGDPLTPR